MTEQRLCDLKAGDTVVIQKYEFGDEKWITAKIQRVTKTQIVIEPFYKFSRTSGLEIGGGWNRHEIHLATPEFLERVRQTAHRDTLKRLVVQIQRANDRVMMRIPEETLRAFVEAIDAAKNEGDGK